MYPSKESNNLSHVDMSVFWSGTDTNTIKELGKEGWITATVFNKKYESRSALCYNAESETKSPWGTFKENKQVIVDELELVIWKDWYTDELTAQWDKEFEDNVKKKTWTPQPWSQGNLGKWYILDPW